MPRRKPTPGTQLPIDTIELEPLLGSEWAEFRIAYVTGSGWQLFTPQWRRGFTPGEIKSHFYQVQGASRDRLIAAQAAAEIERANQRADQAEQRAAWYRSQLVLESRAGAMLARIMEKEE